MGRDLNEEEMKGKRRQTGRESLSQWGGGKGEGRMNECAGRMNAGSGRGDMKAGEAAFIRF